MTNLGYALDFEATDCYTEKFLESEKLTAEFTRGVLFYVMLKQFKIGVCSEYYMLPKIIGFQFD